MSATPYHVTVVSHTHWDREWYRPYQNFRLQLIQVVDQLLDLLATHPGYHSFLLDGQTIILEDYLDVRPEREAELRRFVGEGRLFIGPWHVMPDEFLVGPESLVRNFMLGARICERFGRRMAIGYTPDPFGHISQMPQILAGVEIDSAAFQRGLSEEPAELWWEAPDGTRVLTLYLREGYGNLSWVPPSLKAFMSVVETQIARLSAQAHTPNLLMLNGTDHMLPQPELPDLIAIANEHLGGRAILEHGTLPDYLARVRAALGDTPLLVVKGELRDSRRHNLLPGVLSARMWVKQRNQDCETELTRYAEPVSALVSALGGTDYRAELWRSWRYLLENHPHDSICGCSIDQVHEEMRIRFDWSQQIASQLSENGLRYLASQIHSAVLLAPEVTESAPNYAALAGAREHGVIVFNPTQGSRNGLVEVSVPWPGAGHQYELLDDIGASVPCRWLDVHEMIDEQRTLTLDEMLAFLEHIEVGFYGWRLMRDVHVWIDGDEARLEVVFPEYHTGEVGDFAPMVEALRNDPALQAVKRCHLTIYLAGFDRMAFVAQDVPGVGYRMYRLHRRPGKAQVQTLAALTGTEIENEYFRLRANEQDGTLTLMDKASGVVYTGLNRFVDDGDRGDEYNFCAPENNRAVNAPAHKPFIERSDDGPLGQTLCLRFNYEVPLRLEADRASRSDDLMVVLMDVTVSLRPGVRRVDIQTTVNNGAEDHRLRVLFPTPIISHTAVVDSHFDRLARSSDLPQNTADWQEQPVATAPQRAFAAVGDEKRGLMVAVRGLPEYELMNTAEGSTLAVTLLRCVGWLSREDFACRRGHAGPELETPGAQCPGEHRFEYSLIPFGSDLDSAAQEAYAFEAPLRGLAVALGHGTLSPRQALISLEPAELVLTAIKPSEEGHGLVVRFYNSAEYTVKGRLNCALAMNEACIVNLLEHPVNGSALQLPMSFDAAPKQIVTVLIGLLSR